MHDPRVELIDLEALIENEQAEFDRLIEIGDLGPFPDGTHLRCFVIMRHERLRDDVRSGLSLDDALARWCAYAIRRAPTLDDAGPILSRMPDEERRRVFGWMGEDD